MNISKEFINDKLSCIESNEGVVLCNNTALVKLMDIIRNENDKKNIKLRIVDDSTIILNILNTDLKNYIISSYKNIMNNKVFIDNLSNNIIMVKVSNSRSF